jgi:hypothetical protein
MKNEFSFLSEPGFGHPSDKNYLSNPNSGWYKINDYYDSVHATRTKFKDLDTLKTKRIILVVGDSFTFGDGVYYKDTFTNLLKKNFFKSKDYIVINIGYPGISNSNIMQRVNTWLNVLSDNIETVIVGWTFSSRRAHFFDNEYSSISSNSLYQRDSTLLPHEEQIYRYNFNMGNSLPKTTLKKYNVKHVYNHMVQVNSRVNDYRDFETHALIMKYATEYHNFKLYWWGWLWQGSFGWHDRDVLIDSFSDKNSIFMDIDSEAKNYESLSEDDGHWSPKGHSDVAKTMIKYLKSDPRYDFK